MDDYKITIMAVIVFLIVAGASQCKADLSGSDCYQERITENFIILETCQGDFLTAAARGQ